MEHALLKVKAAVVGLGRCVGVWVTTRVQAGLQRQAPVLFLSECVLVYLQVQCFHPASLFIFLVSVCVLWLQPAEGDAIVRWAAGFVNGGAGGVFVTYEQIHPHDAFGQVCGLHFPLI